ncbi:P-loop NTPase fold protein [Pseudomonas sp. MWU16-30323]|uniref:KAP family P-loop NTPase fold protein n=1 Tax=Pseudomonas sp. MWU16-30323 TaxID=2878094 RepID=UPI001CFBB4B0|nr:P-loop NTPase fold protein [Pseudomonas sp. MWU16-30323]
MKLVAAPLNIANNGKFEGDLFERKSFGVSLSNIIKNSTDPLVIGLDGSWGEGKTTFVKMWQGLLTDEGLPSIYIDAFANDHTDDAFMVVASAITDYASLKLPTPIIKELIDKTKKVGAQLFSWGTKIAIKALTLGVIKGSDIDDLKSISKDVSDSFSNTAENLIKEKLISHKDDLESIQSFKDFLSTLPSLLAGREDGPPLTLIIDELDRCRPSFAVEILEKVKHLFSVENITFVLVMNKKQLEESIKFTYGPNIDAHTYLQKFLTLEATLPKRLQEQHNDIRIYCESLYTRHDLPSGLDTNFIRFTSGLANHLNLSLRQIEKVFANITLSLSSFSSPSQSTAPILILICTIKSIRPDLFVRIVKSELTFTQLREEINFIHKNKTDHYLIVMMLWAEYCLMPDAEFDKLPPDHELVRLGQSMWGDHRDGILTRHVKSLTNFSIR